MELPVNLGKNSYQIHIENGCLDHAGQLIRKVVKTGKCALITDSNVDGLYCERVMRSLREHGRTVPDDCSVIAIDGIEVSDYIDPPLTTLCQPMEKMGRRSIEILLDMIEGRAGNFHEVLPTVLRVGGSVKKLV